MFADILIILLIRYTGFFEFLLIYMRVYKLFKSFLFSIAAFA